MKNYQWLVVGAGPAGIAAIGKLLDASVSPEKIAWIDPYFEAGDLGRRWRHVSSNTKVKLFTRFLLHCQSFEYASVQHTFALNTLEPDSTCELSYAADPLLWVSNHLRKKVCSIQDKVNSLELMREGWVVRLANQEEVYAHNVILAFGSEPKALAYDLPMITLENALHPEKLAQYCHAGDQVAVFGSSHSAVMAIRHLLALSVKVVNFYLSPFRYAVYLDNDEILFDDTGLKGQTAVWAKTHLHGTLPQNLTRVLGDEKNLQAYLPLCTKAVYAVGFERRQEVVVEGVDLARYNDRSGILAPGLFGMGIAFPQAKSDRFGNVEHRVGVWKFMRYLDEVLPVWMKYGSGLS